VDLFKKRLKGKVGKGVRVKGVSCWVVLNSIVTGERVRKGEKEELNLWDREEKGRGKIRFQSL